MLYLFICQCEETSVNQPRNAGGLPAHLPETFLKLHLSNSPGQRPEACLILCLSCFKSISLIIVRSQGPRWAKLGVLDTARIPVWEENRSKIVWWRSLGAPRGVFGRFSCRPSCAHVSGSLRGPFWEPFWPQKCSFGDLVFWSRGSFF